MTLYGSVGVLQHAPAQMATVQKLSDYCRFPGRVNPGSNQTA